MAQAGVLGNLEYREEEHGWALDLGQQSARYDLLSGSLQDDQVPGITESRRDMVQHMNDILITNRVRYRIPDIIPGADHRQVGDDLLEFMRRDATPTFLAFYLIGTAVFYLSMKDAADSKYDSEMIDLALNRLQNINVRCPGVQIQPRGLLNVLLTSEISPIGIRLLLANLNKPLVILLVTADPVDEAPLRLLKESRQLMKALQAANLKNAFKIEQLPSCQPTDLSKGMRLYKPTILHFSGHGSQTGLAFEGPDGKAVTVNPKRLAGLLSLASRELDLKGVFMNACDSQAHASIIAEAVGEVVAMKGELGDEAAIAFAQEFYGCLGDGLPFEQSFEWALEASGLSDTVGPLRPHLIQAERRRPVDTGRRTRREEAQSQPSGYAASIPGSAQTTQAPTLVAANDVTLSAASIEGPGDEISLPVEVTPPAQITPRLQLAMVTDSVASMHLATTAIAAPSSDLTATVRPGRRAPPPIPPKNVELRSGQSTH